MQPHAPKSQKVLMTAKGCRDSFKTGSQQSAIHTEGPGWDPTMPLSDPDSQTQPVPTAWNGPDRLRCATIPTAPSDPLGRQ